MKSKVFKFVLPAFAFAFAIVASFAFTPALNGENAVLTDAYITNGSSCIDSGVNVDCDVNNPGELCTFTIAPDPTPRIALQQGTCAQLFRP